MLLFSLGPFKVNGVPIRRVNQSYVIATSTKVDISKVNMQKFDDKYFAREKKTRVKKTEGELFETDKEVYIPAHSFSVAYPCIINLVPIVTLPLLC
jgi:large subunit ribosomal protein L6e